MPHYLAALWHSSCNCAWIPVSGDFKVSPFGTGSIASVSQNSCSIPRKTIPMDGLLPCAAPPTHSWLSACLSLGRKCPKYSSKRFKYREPDGLECSFWVKGNNAAVPFFRALEKTLSEPVLYLSKPFRIWMSCIQQFVYRLPLINTWKITHLLRTRTPTEFVEFWCNYHRLA